MSALIVVLSVILVAVTALRGWRAWDRRIEARTWDALVRAPGTTDTVFEPDLVEDLPAPARRYFLYTIGAGTPLRRAVDIEMTGELGFGDKTRPRYRPMRAHQILVPPQGFVWRADAGPLGGSDGLAASGSWTRFWLFGCVPVVRAGGNEDHRRSAFGRVVAEAAFWAPASLLPGNGVHWEGVDDSIARAVVRCGGLEQAVDINVAKDGRPTRVVIKRWSNENPERSFREQPFGGDLSEFRDFGGYRLPTRVEGGNHIGTSDYFPFFRAEVTSIDFPDPLGRPGWR